MSDAKADDCLLSLLEMLAAHKYRFVTPTPATHRRNLARMPGRRAQDLREIFGWSMPFVPEDVPQDILGPLRSAGMLEETEGLLRSRVRVSSLGGRLFLHSAFPPDAPDAIFFGPDTYRFARFIGQELRGSEAPRHIVDIGTGSGAGAIVAGVLYPEARLTLTDTNPRALRFARINARHAGLAVETVEVPGLGSVTGFDLALANPPFMAGSGDRTYRDGGEMLGAALSLAWAEDAARRLAPGGRMLLYTASAIVGGEDRLEMALDARLPELGCTMRYSEIDPDIFGGQLSRPGYEKVERLAAIGAVITKTSETS